MASSRISSTLSLVRTRMDTGTAGTTWETRGTHTLRLSRKRWCTSACPQCCGHIIPSRLPGFRPPEPRTPHVQRAPTSCNDGSQPTNTHERTSPSHTSTHTERRTRTARPKGPPHGLSTCTDHAFSPRSCATGPPTALKPHMKSNRCQTFPMMEPDIEGDGRAPAARRRILVVSGIVYETAVWCAIPASVVGCGYCSRNRTTVLRYK